MESARAEESATVICGGNGPADGKILIAGGRSATGSLGATLRSAELYDPATGKFTATSAMKATRAHHSATLIASGPLAGNVPIARGPPEQRAAGHPTPQPSEPSTR